MRSWIVSYHKKKLSSVKVPKKHCMFYYSILKKTFSIHVSCTDRNQICASVKADARCKQEAEINSGYDLFLLLFPYGCSIKTDSLKYLLVNSYIMHYTSIQTTKGYLFKKLLYHTRLLRNIFSRNIYICGIYEIANKMTEV